MISTIRLSGRRVFAAMILATLSVGLALAQATGEQGHAVVTIEGSQKTLSSETVSLSVKDGDARITNFTQFKGDDAGLQLLILIDDSAHRSLALQYDDVKKFIMSMPETTQVGVAYMQNGVARFAKTFTTDHAAAAAALRIPSGTAGSNGSPYFVLSDVSKHWSTEQPNGAPALRPGAVRREVLMFTNGVEAYDSERFNPSNPYVASAIEDSLRAGVIVYAIYVRDVGTAGFADAEANNGQNYLVQLTDATGGKTYYIGNNPSPNFRPYLNDLKQKLNNQYRLEFTTNSRRKSVDIKVKAQGAKVYAPVRVYLDQAQ